MCLSFGEEIEMSFLFYQDWLDVCCIGQPLVHPVKRAFSLIGEVLNKTRTRLSAESISFDQFKDRAIVEVLVDQYLKIL